MTYHCTEDHLCTYRPRMTREEAAGYGITLGDHDLVAVKAHDWGGGVMDCTVLEHRGGDQFLVNHYGHPYLVPKHDILRPFRCVCDQTDAHPYSASLDRQKQ